MGLQPWGRCSRRPKRYQSCFRSRAIRWPLVLSKAWRDRGGNITGFSTFEYSIGAKWLELLKQIAPHLTRAAVLQQTGLPAVLGQFGAIQSAAPSLGVEVKPMNVHDAASIETGVATFARGPNGGMIVTAGALPQRHRDLIIALAARHKLPTVYFERSFVMAGGPLSSGGKQNHP